MKPQIATNVRGGMIKLRLGGCKLSTPRKFETASSIFGLPYDWEQPRLAPGRSSSSAFYAYPLYAQYEYDNGDECSWPIQEIRCNVTNCAAWAHETRSGKEGAVCFLFAMHATSASTIEIVDTLAF